MDINWLIDKAKREKKNLVFAPDKNIVSLVKKTYSADFDIIKDLEIYSIDEFNEVKKLDTTKLLQEIAKTLSKHINPEDVIRNLLRDLSPTEVMDIYERAVVRNGTISVGRGCFEISIGGKRGQPLVIGFGRL